MERRGEGLRCLIAAGGTAGHVVPALAIADALRERGARVTFAGSQRAEARLVPEAGYELDAFAAVGLPRRPGLPLVHALGVAAHAPIACAHILGRRKPHVVLGGGGYVSGPMALAAAARRVPLALTEADAHLGLANRLAAPFADRVFLAFPIRGREPPKYRVTGRPLRRRHSNAHDRAAARRVFGLPEDGRVLLVFGGSLGARALNEFALRELGAAGPPVLHLAGERWEPLPSPPRSDYRLLRFATDFDAALAASDLALARAGGSVWELAAAGLPAVLVPSPNVTADHQTKNARFFEAAGGAIMLPEQELSERGGELVRSLLGDAARLRSMREAMLRTARPQAADEIAEELIVLARRA